MPPLSMKPRTAASLLWVAYATVGALLAVWGGLWMTVLLRHPPGRAAVLGCAAFSAGGLVVLLAGLLTGSLGVRTPSGRSRPAGTRALRIGPLSPDLRLDRPHASGSRTRRPHCRFR